MHKGSPTFGWGLNQGSKTPRSLEALAEVGVAPEADILLWT